MGGPGRENTPLDDAVALVFRFDRRAIVHHGSGQVADHCESFQPDTGCMGDVVTEF